MTAKIQVRRDVTGSAGTGWSSNPTLVDGEIGFDTTLNQVKIGNGGVAWNSLPWLGGTLPQFASPSSTDLDNASNSIAGVYRFSNGSALTNAPAAPIDIKAADGGATMLVIKVGSIAVQQLWTDGDGTQPVKSFSRMNDGAWKAWVPQNSWGVSSTEGVDASLKSVTVKDAMTVEGVASFADGSASAPSITNTGDTNTGIAFTAADTIALATNATARVTVTDATTTVSNGLVVSGTAAITGAVTMSSTLATGGTLTVNGKVSSVTDPTAAQDAVTKAFLEANRIGQVALIQVSAAGAITNQVMGSGTSPGFTGSGAITNLRSAAGTWQGFITFGQNENTVGGGNTANVSWVTITTTSCTSTNGNPTVAYSLTLIRTA